MRSIHEGITYNVPDEQVIYEESDFMFPAQEPYSAKIQITARFPLTSNQRFVNGDPKTPTLEFAVFECGRWRAVTQFEQYVLASYLVFLGITGRVKIVSITFPEPISQFEKEVAA